MNTIPENGVWHELGDQRGDQWQFAYLYHGEGMDCYLDLSVEGKWFYSFHFEAMEPSVLDEPIDAKTVEEAQQTVLVLARMAGYL